MYAHADDRRLAVSSRASSLSPAVTPEMVRRLLVPTVDFFFQVAFAHAATIAVSACLPEASSSAPFVVFLRWYLVGLPYQCRSWQSEWWLVSEMGLH